MQTLPFTLTHEILQLGGRPICGVGPMLASVVRYDEVSHIWGDLVGAIAIDLRLLFDIVVAIARVGTLVFLARLSTVLIARKLVLDVHDVIVDGSERKRIRSRCTRYRSVVKRKIGSEMTEPGCVN
jgi:hypothetical protein